MDSEDVSLGVCAFPNAEKISLEFVQGCVLSNHPSVIVAYTSIRYTPTVHTTSMRMGRSGTKSAAPNAHRPRETKFETKSTRRNKKKKRRQAREQKKASRRR